MTPIAPAAVPIPIPALAPVGSPAEGVPGVDGASFDVVDESVSEVEAESLPVPVVVPFVPSSATRAFHEPFHVDAQSARDPLVDLSSSPTTTTLTCEGRFGPGP